MIFAVYPKVGSQGYHQCRFGLSALGGISVSGHLDPWYPGHRTVALRATAGPDDEAPGEDLDASQMGEYVYRECHCLVHSDKEVRGTLLRAFQEIQSSLCDQVGFNMHIARLAFNAAVSSSKLVVAARVASGILGQKSASPSALYRLQLKTAGVMA
jgi:hypothetical protein